MNRIVHTVASIENLASGPSYSVTGLAEAQVRLGAEVALYSIEGHGGTSASTYSFSSRKFPNSFSSLPVLQRLCFSLPMRRALQCSAPAIIHTHGLWLMPNIYRRPGSLFVIAPRGMLAPVALAFSPQKKWLFRNLFQNRAFAAASLFHATAESEFEDIRAFGLKQPVAIIPNGIDVPALPIEASRGDERTLLSLGRIHPKKALDSLIRAFAMVAASFPTWRLRIVGPDEGGHAAELLRLVNMLGVPGVSIEPPVFGAEKQSLMAAADLFALPSHSENFGMTVAESLALGVPVISTRGAPWAGLETERCGRWIEHGPEALAVALRELMSISDHARQQMGARGRDWMVRDFSWDRMAQLSVKAYAWALGQGDRPACVRVD